MSAFINVHDLYYTYRTGSGSEVPALKGVDLEIYSGEWLAVTGRNGSGKSTLARHLNGLLAPSSGEVKVEGLSVKEKSNIKKIRSKVGMVFQNPDNQLVSSVVEEDVAFGPENMGVPPEEIRQRVEWALETVGMASFRHESPAELSNGQKQMVAIAGVLAMRPQAVVLDEPTAHLDPRSRREIIEGVKKLNREEGITIIYITHFMEEAVHADRMAIMDAGEMKTIGSPREVFRDTENTEKLGMDLPFPLQLVRGLRDRGFNLPDDLIFAEEFVRELCRLK